MPTLSVMEAAKNDADVSHLIYVGTQVAACGQTGRRSDPWYAVAQSEAGAVRICERCATSCESRGAQIISKPQASDRRRARPVEVGGPEGLRVLPMPTTSRIELAQSMTRGIWQYLDERAIVLVPEKVIGDAISQLDAILIEAKAAQRNVEQKALACTLDAPGEHDGQAGRVMERLGSICDAANHTIGQLRAYLVTRALEPETIDESSR